LYQRNLTDQLTTFNDSWERYRYCHKLNDFSEAVFATFKILGVSFDTHQKWCFLIIFCLYQRRGLSHLS